MRMIETVLKAGLLIIREFWMTKKMTLSLMANRTFSNKVHFRIRDKSKLQFCQSALHLCGSSVVWRMRAARGRVAVGFDEWRACYSWSALKPDSSRFVQHGFRFSPSSCYAASRPESIFDIIRRPLSKRLVNFRVDMRFLYELFRRLWTTYDI